MPGEELIRRIRGDWYEIRERYDELYELEEVFSFSLEELNVIVADLRVSVEQGVTEYKQHKLQKLSAFLDSLKYDSKGFDNLSMQARDFAHLVYVVLIQRLIAIGLVPIRSGESSDHEGPDSAASDMGIKDILEEIQERIRHKPDLKNDPRVKNIFMQVNIYRRELANMQKLVPNILPEKKKSFLSNFKTTFDQITEKVRDHYRAILREDEEQAAKEIVPTNPLKKHDLKPFGNLFDNQAEEFSVVQSTLSFAAIERYKTRDILATIVEKKDRLLELVISEQKQYANLEAGPGGARMLSRAFGAELIAVLNRQITRMS
jgi:hypothetical protein